MSTDGPRRMMARVMSARSSLLWTTALTAAFSGLVAAAEDWPQFRGPTMNAAVAENPNLPEEWSQTENIEWSTDIPGLGWSSPVVWGDRVFLTTVTAAGEFEQPKPGLYAPNGRPSRPRSTRTGESIALTSRPGRSSGSGRSSQAFPTSRAT